MRTLLLLVDLQRAFCDSGGSMTAQGRDIAAMRRAAEVCDELARLARARGVPVVWARMVFRPGYADGGMLLRLRPNLTRIGALVAGTPDCELSEFVHPSAEDIVFDKPRYSVLYATPLEAILRSGAVERVVVGGVTTSMCVETSVRDLGQRDYDVAVVREACADFDEARHEASLAAMAFGFARIVAASTAPALLAGEALEP